MAAPVFSVFAAKGGSIGAMPCVLAHPAMIEPIARNMTIRILSHAMETTLIPL